MACTDPRNRMARRLGVPPRRHAPPRLTDPPSDRITSQRPTYRPRHGPSAACLLWEELL